jgi:potassium-dependent mechanosensitive channel
MRKLTMIVLIVALVFPAAANVNPQQEQLTKFGDEISSVETSIESKADDDTALVKMRIDLDRVSKGLIDFGVSLRPRINDINVRLEAVGAAPKEGEPPEPESSALERKALLEEKSQYNLLLGDAENLSIRASRAIERIGILRREIFSNALLKQTDTKGTISFESLTEFQKEFNNAGKLIWSRLQFMYSFRAKQLLAATGLSALIGLIAAFIVLRLFGFIGHSARVGSDDSYIDRLSLAFWSTTIPAFVVAASLALAYALFSYFGVFTPQIESLTEAILISAVAIYFIQRLASALLAPDNPERRLIMVSDAAARTLFVLIVCLSVIHVLDFFIGRLNETFFAPLKLTIAKSLISSLLISALLVLIGLVRPFRDSAGRSHGWPGWVRIPIFLVAIFIIAAALSGYIGLARFAAAQVVVTAAILATMYIGVQSGQILAAEGVFPQSTIGRRIKTVFSLSDAMLDQLGLLLSLFVYATVIIVGLPLLLLQWGFNYLDIQIWLYRILTDIRIGNISISLLGIFFGLCVFVIGFLVTRRFQRWLDSSVMARGRVDAGVRNSIRTIVGYLGVALAAIIGLSAAGFDLSSLALVAGALSLGIGFGLQNVVSNFVSGLILLAERPFKVGDWIVAGNTAGFVKKISVRATEIETFQNQTVILPNSELINQPVGNWTHRNHRARLEIPVGVAYGSKPRAVHGLLSDIASSHPQVLKTPPPTVVFKGFGESSLDFEVRIHIPEVLDGLAIATELRFQIVEALEQAGISIPFPQRDVNLKLQDIEALAEAVEKVRTRRRQSSKPKS